MPETDEWIDWWDVIHAIDPDTTDEQFWAMWQRVLLHRYYKRLH